VDIKGDVSAFGTFPKDILWPEQFYYGGIMAMHGAQVDIKGNAYSRAFIRTGPYRMFTGDFLSLPSFQTKAE